MLSALTTSLPRYAVEGRLGTHGLGVFAAVVSLVTIGSTVINALGQAATTRLANHFTARDRIAFRRLALQLVGLAASLGTAGALAAWLIGDSVLALVYRPEYAQYQPLLVAALLAGIPVYVAGVLGYVVTSTRRFAAQMPLLAAVAGACAITSYLAVPAAGLNGAILALAVAACVQIAGQLVILGRAS
jgi:O-antigen/teichoic acid export membrane protein